MEADLQKSVDQHYDLKMKYEELQKLKEKSDDEKEILNRYKWEIFNSNFFDSLWKKGFFIIFNFFSELFNEKQAFEYMKSELEKTHKNWKTKENEWQLQKTRLEVHKYIKKYNSKFTFFKTYTNICYCYSTFQELLQKNRNSLSNELHEENNRLKKEMESMTEQLEDLKKNVTELIFIK